MLQRWIKCQFHQCCSGKAKNGLAYVPSSRNKTLKIMNNIITLKEVAQITRLSTSTIYKLTRAGKLPHSKPNGKKLYYRRSDIEAWMMSGENREDKA